MLYRELDSASFQLSKEDCKEVATQSPKQMLARTCGVLENLIVDQPEMRESLFILNDEDDKVLRPRRGSQGGLSAHLGLQGPRVAEAFEPARRSSSSASVCSPDGLIPVLRGKLYFTVQEDSRQVALAQQEHHEFCFFTSTHHESYLPYNMELGPVDVGVVVSFWRELRERLATSKDVRPLVYHSLSLPGHATNAALLLGCFLVLEHGFSAERAASVFEVVQPSPFVPFVDASGMKGFSLALRDCFAALERAMSAGWFSPLSFDVREFERLSLPSGGDLTLIGDKFIAFKGPVADEALMRQREAHPPGLYVDMFARLGVGAVVRLNEADEYEAGAFTQAGMRHEELQFRDCSHPSRSVAKRFLDICDEAGRVAVHCKAGLGRTGTLIALWMMKHKAFTAKEAIAWLRLSRPGSVIGTQQTYLAKCEQREWSGNMMGRTPAGEGGTRRGRQEGRHEAEEVVARVPSTETEQQATETERLAARFDSECRHRAAVRGGSAPNLLANLGGSDVCLTRSNCTD